MSEKNSFPLPSREILWAFVSIVVGSLVDKESKENNKNVSLNAEAQNRLIRLKQEQNVQSKKKNTRSKERRSYA